MPARPALPAGPFLVVGLARSGLAVAPALRERGATVTGVDARPVPAEAVAALEAARVVVRAPSDGLAELGGVRAVVKSPGVPNTAPVVRAARERGIPVLGELEIGWRLVPNDVIAVTGSNGKTTTTELLGHLHRAAGIPVAVVGNVGTALTTLPGTVSADTVVACECSSYQLEDAVAFAPDAAILLNVTEDHLDRHGTFAAYRDAKLRIFANQGPDAFAVAPDTLDIEDARGEARRVRFGESEHAALRLDGRTLSWAGEPVIHVDEIRLRGPHNLENAMAAATACLARGMDSAAVREGLATFAGVPHRLEEVARRDGVLYVNDSKATNPASTIVALSSFADGVHVILGGQGKGADFGVLAEPVRAHCAAAYLIGEDAERVANGIAATGVPLHRCGDLASAVAAARAAARPGEVVLLSPACASFDQFRDFEHRGAEFRALVAG